MESEEELLKDSYEFYHAAVKELEEETKERARLLRTGFDKPYLLLRS